MKIKIITLLLAAMVSSLVGAQTMQDYMTKIYNNVPNSAKESPVIANKGAEAILIDESFEGDELPEDWTFYYLEENGSWTHWLGLGNFGDQCIKHPQVSSDVDSWMVSPQVYIDADNYELSFYEFAAQWESNSCNILVSSGSGDPADGDFMQELTVGAAGWWEYHLIDLSAYEGEDIYVAFQVVTITQDFCASWFVDDIYVAPSEFTDGGVTLTAPVGYSPDTGEEDIIVTIENFGTETISGFDVDWWVNDVQQTTYVGSSNIGSGNSLVVTIGQYDFIEEANYSIKAEIFITDDDDATNNLDSAQYSVGLSNDLQILSMSPTGNSPFNEARDIAVELKNNGNSIIYDFEIEWEVNGTSKPNAEIIGIDLMPGETQLLVFEDNYFPDGIHNIWIGIPIDFDLTPEDNEIEGTYAVGGLYEDFQGNYPPDQWRVHYSLKSNWEPQSGDPDNFYAETWAGSNSFGNAKDTTYTPRLDISEGDEMTLMGFGSLLTVVWIDGETGDVNLLETVSMPVIGWEEFVIDLTAAAGQNYIGLVNAAGAWGVTNFDDVTCTSPIFTYEYDLALFDQSIDQIMLTNETHVLECRVKNIGEEDILGTEYSVKLMNDNGAILATLPGVDLNAFDSRTFEFNYTFINQGNYNVYMTVDYAMDEDLTSNTGEEVVVHAAPQNTQFPTIGAPDYPGLEFPFNTRGIADGYPYGDEDFSQVLFYSDEIGTPGMIHGIKYFYRNITAYGSETPLKVWVANTDVVEFEGDGWYPQDDFQQIFEDTIYTTAGDGFIYIQFDEPYFYDGVSNLIFQHHSYDPSFLFCPSDIWATVSEENVRVNTYVDYHGFDLEDLPMFSWKRTDYPHTSFVIEPLDNIGVINGIVYDENNDPLSDAEVIVEGTTVSVITGADGFYELPPLTFGSHTMKVDKFGYDYHVQTIELEESVLLLDIYLEPRPQVELSGNVVGSNDESIPLEDVVVTLNGYSYYVSSTDELGDFVLTDPYGNESYQITCVLYGYETFIDTIELMDVNLDLGTIVLQEKFIPAVNVLAQDNDTEALIEWVDPVASNEDYLIKDMNEDMGGFANEPYEDVWLGNRFENSGLITLTDADIFFTFDEGGTADSVQVDIFNEAGEVIASSAPFITPWYDWVNLDLPNMTIDGDFFIMVHWKSLENTTHFLCYDYDWNLVMPNAAYIKYPGEDLISMQEYFQEYPHFSFWVRAQVLDGNGGEGTEAALGYNIYRGFADDIEGAEQWEQLNLDPVTETSYIDETWPPIGVNSYMYAVEALYAEADAEVTFSNNLDGGIVTVDQQRAEIYLFPNPVKDVLQIQLGEQIEDISVMNGMGQVIIHQSGVNTTSLELDFQGQVPGIYYLQIKSDSSVRTSKIIKQ